MVNSQWSLVDECCLLKKVSRKDAKKKEERRKADFTFSLRFTRVHVLFLILSHKKPGLPPFYDTLSNTNTHYLNHGLR